VRGATSAIWVMMALGPPLLGGEPADIVARHLARLDSLKTLVLRVERVTTYRGKSQTERWTFSQKAPSCFRIEVEFPTRRTIVANEAELWEYIPEAKKAARTDLAALGAREREATLRAALSRVALDGLRFEAGGTDRELHYAGAEQVDGRPAHRIECRRPGDPKGEVACGWIDAERGVLLRSGLLDKRGRTLASTQASDFAEVAPGTWFPRRLSLTLLGPRGRSQELTFKRVEINSKLPDDLFTFQVPEGVEVVGPQGK